MLESCLEFAVVESREVPCSAATVWSLATDYDNIPRIISSVDSSRRIDGSSPGDPLEVGSKFRIEIRLDTGERWESDMTVTALQADGDEDGFKTRKVTVFTHNMAGTATASRTTLVEAMSPDECRVTITMAIMPDKFFTIVVGRMFCCCTYKRSAQRSLEQDIDDLVKGASTARSEPEHALDEQNCAK